jgi:predicted transcriptional regulator YdeE
MQFFDNRTVRGFDVLEFFYFSTPRFLRSPIQYHAIAVNQLWGEAVNLSDDLHRNRKRIKYIEARPFYNNSNSELKEVKLMKYKTIIKESFPIIGMELRTTTENGKNFDEIPIFWENVQKNSYLDQIPNKKYDGIVLGICMGFESDGSFSYIIGAEVKNLIQHPAGMVCKTIPAARYAVFTACGMIPKSIQDTFKYIYQEWLPNSEYRRGASAEFELYDDRSHNGDNAEADIYIPIVFS